MKIFSRENRTPSQASVFNEYKVQYLAREAVAYPSCCSIWYLLIEYRPSPGQSPRYTAEPPTSFSRYHTHIYIAENTSNKLDSQLPGHKPSSKNKVEERLVATSECLIS